MTRAIHTGTTCYKLNAEYNVPTDLALEDAIRLVQSNAAQWIVTQEATALVARETAVTGRRAYSKQA